MLLQLCHGATAWTMVNWTSLRDVDDRKAYIVDVNNTRFPVPPKILDSRSAALALKRLSETFAASFGSTS